MARKPSRRGVRGLAADGTVDAAPGIMHMATRLDRLQSQLAQARAELRVRLWRANPGVLDAVQACERDVERLLASAQCPSPDSLELAIFRLRGIAAALA